MAVSKRAIAVGDRVEIGVGDEYDVGTVVQVTRNGVRVHWERADETYSKNPDDLRLVSRGGASR